MADLFGNLDFIKSNPSGQALAKRLGVGEFSPESIARNKAEGSRSNFGDLLNNLIKRGQGLTERPALSAQDLFGESLTRIFDSTGQMANATKQALSRAIMGRGGDVSGRQGASILGVDQGTASELGKTGLQFERLADQINRSEVGRGEGLISQGLQGLQNLLSFDEGRLQTILQRGIQREQAKKQRRSNLLGNLLMAGGTAAMAFCWVAEELYGKDDERTHIVRSFLITNPVQAEFIDEFREKYEREGRRWAKQVRDDKVTRMKAEKTFNKIIEMAKAA